MKTSAIILTYNSERSIIESLDSVFENLDDEDEIIIIDNCSSDNTISLLKQFKENKISDDKKIDINIYKSKINLKISRGRNWGCKLAKYDMLCYIDSDIVVEPNSFKSVKNNFDDKNPDAIIGIYNEYGDGYNWYIEMERDIFDLKRKENFDGYITLKKYTTFSGGLCFIKKEIFQKYFGYDTAFDKGPSEDINLELKMLKDNKKIYVDKNFKAKHKKDRVKFLGLMKRAKRNGIGILNLIKDSHKWKYEIPYNDRWPYLPINLWIFVISIISFFITKNIFIRILFLLLMIYSSWKLIIKVLASKLPKEQKYNNLKYRIAFVLIRMCFDFTMSYSLIKNIFTKRYKNNDENLTSMKDIELEKI